MCRFIAYSGPPTPMQELLLESSYSLVSQSRRARMRFEPVNGDGFGVGWYPTHADPVPATFVSIEPAWSNRNLREIAAKVTTGHFFAHVRDATPGMPVSQANCHPFKHGKWLWMHNGFLGEFSRYRRHLLSSLSDAAFATIMGNTDSEHAFALFLDALEDADAATTDQALAALTAAIQRVADLKQAAGCDAEAHMNFAVTNGQLSLFTRFGIDTRQEPPTLHYLQGGDSLVVASEPLSEKGDWQQVQTGKVLVLEQGKSLEISDFGL